MENMNKTKMQSISLFWLDSMKNGTHPKYRERITSIGDIDEIPSQRSNYQ